MYTHVLVMFESSKRSIPYMCQTTGHKMRIKVKQTCSILLVSFRPSNINIILPKPPYFDQQQRELVISSLSDTSFANLLQCAKILAGNWNIGWGGKFVVWCGESICFHFSQQQHWFCSRGESCISFFPNNNKHATTSNSNHKINNNVSFSNENCGKIYIF